jgi:hypothetical protein
MYFGFRALYLMAMALYSAALVWDLVASRAHRLQSVPVEGGVLASHERGTVPDMR